MADFYNLKMRKRYIVEHSWGWNYMLRESTNDADECFKIAHTINLDVVLATQHSMIAAPCAPNGQLWRRRSLSAITPYILYLEALTQGMYNGDVLKQFLNLSVATQNIIDGKFEVNAIRDTLIYGDHIVSIAKHVVGQLGRKYKRNKKDDIIPARLVSDFADNGGLEMIAALNDGLAFEDILCA